MRGNGRSRNMLSRTVDRKIQSTVIEQILRTCHVLRDSEQNGRGKQLQFQMMVSTLRPNKSQGVFVGSNFSFKFIETVTSERTLRK